MHRPRQHRIRLTVLVAWLSKGLSLGENDGHSQILEGGDIEEGGVLVVPDVFVVVRACHVLAVRETGAGNITGATGGEKKEGVNPNLLIQKTGTQKKTKKKVEF